MTTYRKQPSEDKIKNAVNRRKNRAEDYLKDADKTQQLLNEALHKTKEKEKVENPGKDFWKHLKALFRLLRAYIRNEYRDIPWGSIVLVVVAIIYFVAPIDLIPDWIPLSGFIDDAAVLVFVIRQIRSDLDRFLAWEADKEAGTTIIDIQVK
jgi:uncharacterized membrane protein YkvA (DUF1232 family)